MAKGSLKYLSSNYKRLSGTLILLAILASIVYVITTKSGIFNLGKYAKEEAKCSQNSDCQVGHTCKSGICVPGSSYKYSQSKYGYKYSQSSYYKYSQSKYYKYSQTKYGH